MISSWRALPRRSGSGEGGSEGLTKWSGRAVEGGASCPLAGLPNVPLALWVLS